MVFSSAVDVALPPLVFPELDVLLQEPRYFEEM